MQLTRRLPHFDDLDVGLVDLKFHPVCGQSNILSRIWRQLLTNHAYDDTFFAFRAMACHRFTFAAQHVHYR